MKIEKLYRFIGHRSRVNCVYFGTNFVLSGGEDCCSIVWNPMTGKKIQTFVQEKPVTTCCLMLNDSLAISCDDYTCFIWKTESGMILQLLQFDQRICNINTYKSRLHFKNIHDKIIEIYSLTMMDNDYLFEKSNEEEILNNSSTPPKIIIDPYSEQVTVEFLTNKYIVLTGQTRVAFACFNLKRQLLFTTSETSLDATLKIFSFQSNFIHDDEYIAEPIACFDSHSEGINRIALNDEATYLVTASNDCTLVLIDLFPLERQILLALACSNSSAKSRISMIWSIKIGKMLRDILF